MAVVKGDFRFHKARIVRGGEIHAQDEPPDEMVWDMCVYTRSGQTTDDMRCMGCPRWEESENYGRVQRGCFAMANEACKLSFAWQKRISG